MIFIAVTVSNINCLMIEIYSQVINLLFHSVLILLNGRLNAETNTTLGGSLLVPQGYFTGQ